MKTSELCTARYFAIIATLLISGAAWAFPQTTAQHVSLTGRVSCAKCGPWEPLHKGYTRWTWALHSVSEGDDIVFVVGNSTYRLLGDKDEILKHMENKVTVTGNLEGKTLAVQTIASVSKTR